MFGVSEIYLTAQSNPRISNSNFTYSQQLQDELHSFSSKRDYVAAKWTSSETRASVIIVGLGIRINLLLLQDYLCADY